MSLPWGRAVALGCAVAAAGFALSWAGAATGITPSVLPAPQLKVGKAQADLCPTPAASKALADQGVTLGAQSPAVMANVGGRTCVRMPLTRGEFAMDLSAGSVPADGGVTFTKSTGRTLSFTEVEFNFGTRKADGRATIEGTSAGTRASTSATTPAGTSSGRARAAQQRIDLLTLDFQLDKTKVDLTRGTAEGAASLGLGRGGGNALKDAFGTSPLPAEGTVFDATAGGDVSQAAQSLSYALLP
ncbi:hypothetical protein ACSNOH_00220 [Streptomyces sp. URMC 127]|uniref:hypothetical protein n=1 Tax=Streptomyces sp. URMC 127 TaxID=3423402 RepID=UPI003F1C18DE